MDLFNIIKNKFNTNKKAEPTDFSTAGVSQDNIQSDLSMSGLGTLIPTVVGINSAGSFGSSQGAHFQFGSGSNTYPLYGMHSIVRLYQWMASDPDINWAVDEIVNEWSTSNAKGDSLKLDLSDIELSDKIKDNIHEEFKNVLNLMDFKKSGHNQIKNFFVHGRSFYKIDVDLNDPKKGITKIKLLSPFDIIAYFDNYSNLTVDNYIKKGKKKLEFEKGFVVTENAYKQFFYNGLGQYSFDSTNKFDSGNGQERIKYFAIPSELIVYDHSDITDWRYNVPISYLHLVLKTLNTLRNLKDAMVIYRLTRAPERNIFNIEVGKMGAKKAAQYVDQVARSLKQDLKFDPESGQIADGNNKLNAIKDWFFPQVDGRGTQVESLQGGSMTEQLEEIDSIKKDLFRQLSIPFERYSEEGRTINFNSDGEIEQSEIRFYKFIRKNQIKYDNILMELLKKQLAYKDIITEKVFEEEYAHLIKIEWGVENIFQETKRVGLMTRKSNLLGNLEPYVGRWGITDEFIQKDILGLSDEEIKAADKEIEKDLIKENYRAQIRERDIQFDAKGEKIKEDLEDEE